MKNKIIKVSNDKELIKLWLYKLQKNTLFILEKDIFGLNIGRKEQNLFMMKHVSKRIIILKIKIYVILEIINAIRKEVQVNVMDVVIKTLQEEQYGRKNVN